LLFSFNILILCRAPAEDEENLVPLFKLVPGVATSSDGLACARLGGLPNELIERARQVMQNLEKGIPISPVQTISNAGGVTHQLDQGTPAFDLLQLFLNTSSFTEASDGLIAKFKSLTQKL
jgi:DNA mismatch repair ATPase MutS